MFLTADGATQDEAIGVLPKLQYPVGPNQYTPITMLTLSPPNYDVQVCIAYMLCIQPQRLHLGKSNHTCMYPSGR